MVCTLSTHYVIMISENLEKIPMIKKRRQFLKIVGGGGVSMFLMLFVFQAAADKGCLAY